MYRFAALLSVFLFNPVLVAAQERLNVSSGFGTTELVHVGMHYQFSDVQAGLTFGFVPFLPKEYLVSLSADLYYHFAGHSRFSERQPWFVRTSSVYLRSESTGTATQYIYQAFKVGRDFNLGRQLGLSVSAGPAVNLYHVERTTISSFPPDVNDLGAPLFVPGLDVRFFYRL